MRHHVRRTAIVTAMAVCLGLGLMPAAHASSIVGCAAHAEVARYVTAANNVYTILAHDCVEFGTYSGVNLYNSRTHWHCLRNGVPWDGCRVNARLLLQQTDPATGQYFNLNETIADVSTASLCGGTCYFDDSATFVSNQTNPDNGQKVRGKTMDPDNARILLADGTSVLVDLKDSWSAAVGVT